MNEIIYGKNPMSRIVSIEPGTAPGAATVFRELGGGTVESNTVPFFPYILFTDQHSPKHKPLVGNQPYKFLWETDSLEKYFDVLSKSRKRGLDHYTLRDLKEMMMVREGYTYFKDMRVEDVSVLAFDIETTGITKDKDSRVLLISNTYRNPNNVERKLFSVDEFESCAHMIRAWCEWVREVNPSVLVGHNIFGFDLPYLDFCSNGGLHLGRNGGPAVFANKTSLFRKDGSQAYDYNNVHVFGREIVDTFFLAIKFDIGRAYESYGLKAIVKHEGLERPGRQHYDASKIREDWSDPEKRKQIKAYAIDDADDALKLYDLMIPSLFYYTQSVPRSLQQNVNSATGSQTNSLMVRGYLQQGHSIARGSDAVNYEGAISFGVPGVHKNVFRIDVASLYPSVMRQYKVHSKEKDPHGLFLQLVETFTLERLKNKALGKQTGDRYYKDLEQSQKIAINSMYGFLGASKLSYNYPAGAAEVTRHGRRILTQAMDILKARGFVVVAADTDGIAFKKADERPFTPEDRAEILSVINGQMDELIRFEDDGCVKRQLVVKTKNYILQGEDGTIKIKGSALKATTKEKAFKRFIDKVVDLLLKDRKDQIFPLYFEEAKALLSITDISDYCAKKTVTKSVLNPERTNEQRVLDAIDEETVSEGDKVYVFNKTATELCLREDFDGTYCADTLLKKLYGTLAIFETVLDIDMIPNFTLQRNRELLGLETKRKPKTGMVQPSLGIQQAPIIGPGLIESAKPSPFPPGFFQTRGVP